MNKALRVYGDASGGITQARLRPHTTFPTSLCSSSSSRERHFISAPTYLSLTKCSPEVGDGGGGPVGVLTSVYGARTRAGRSHGRLRADSFLEPLPLAQMRSAAASSSVDGWLCLPLLTAARGLMFALSRVVLIKLCCRNR